MDITVDHQVEVAFLRASIEANEQTIAYLRHQLAQMEKLSRINADEIRRLSRVVAGFNSLHGRRAIDK